jgi:hypothetical protein
MSTQECGHGDPTACGALPQGRPRVNRLCLPASWWSLDPDQGPIQSAIDAKR